MTIHLHWWFVPVVVTILSIIYFAVVFVKDHNEGGMFTGMASAFVFLQGAAASMTAWAIAAIWFK